MSNLEFKYVLSCVTLIRHTGYAETLIRLRGEKRCVEILRNATQYAERRIDTMLKNITRQIGEHTITVLIGVGGQQTRVSEKATTSFLQISEALLGHVDVKIQYALS